jgi:hypothetical protein
MKFEITVSPGQHTTELDLAQQHRSIQIALDFAVTDVADNVFPEFTFNQVTEADCESAGERADREADDAYVARHAAWQPPF